MRPEGLLLFWLLLLLLQAELELKNACFADKSVRQAPCESVTLTLLKLVCWLLLQAELELMNACFADESVRQAPCDLKACSYFTEEAFHQLSVVSPPCWIGKVESTC
jgi:hypothetical protein